MKQESGKVYLVGAGPGDPRLLTLRGAECLAAADVVIYDYLASAELLRYAPQSAERVCLGKHGGGRILSQDEVNGVMVTHAAAGKTVVRLKGGDPNVFGRLVEETAALAEADIPFEIVPGITTASAAGCYAGIAITDRDEASCVAFVTGREQGGKQSADALDYTSLAKFPGTLVFYMGVTTAPAWSAALIAGGKSPQTPVVIIRHCSRATQQTWNCNLGEVAEVLAPGKLRPPIIVIVGEVAQQQSLSQWFTSRPLFGKTILVTRAAHQSEDLGEQFRELGANVLYQPAIEISPPESWQPVDEAIVKLEDYDWLVFSSRNGVEFFLNRLWEQGHDWRKLKNCRIAAVGPGTSAALEENRLRVDLQPDEYHGEAVAALLGWEAKGKNVLLLRASRGRDVLPVELMKAGAKIDQAVVYDSRDVGLAAAPIIKAMDDGEIDWVTVTSSAIAKSLVNLFGDLLRQSKLVAISPLTSMVLDKLGFPPEAIAQESTMDGVVRAIVGEGE